MTNRDGMTDEIVAQALRVAHLRVRIQITILVETRHQKCHEGWYYCSHYCVGDHEQMVYAIWRVPSTPNEIAFSDIDARDFY